MVERGYGAQHCCGARGLLCAWARNNPPQHTQTLFNKVATLTRCVSAPPCSGVKASSRPPRRAVLWVQVDLNVDSHASSEEETGFRVWGVALFVGQFDPMWDIRASSNEAVRARVWLLEHPRFERIASWTPGVDGAIPGCRLKVAFCTCTLNVVLSCSHRPSVAGFVTGHRH